MTDATDGSGRVRRLLAGEGDDAARQRATLPRTLLAPQDGSAPGRPVFDPALKQYGDAYRAGAPELAEPGAAEAWRAARRRALDTVVAAVAASPWADSLVLRGSWTMARWFPGEAREPGDLDFVVVPTSWDIGDARTGRMLADVARAAEEAAGEAAGDGPVIAADGRRTDEIWTYDRVPGRRMVLPWSAAGLPGGLVQLDFVFGEALPRPPVREPLPGGGSVPAASPELSCAWKVLWLLSDMHPQGKDIYDAMLLAERYPPSEALVREVLEQAAAWEEPPPPRSTTAELGRALGPAWHEWPHFAAEHPRQGADFADTTARLLAALRPVMG
ncbi:nucleotidyl transferase AbiEii/AbiGii toxin family protein [Streptomyces sp. NPDC050560]|uniref:nucleotidyl transferase AbiEii/AbiGii toxin family protein n=1 Tax=Streptomyces sp. NPDC050560 TaxID=3365630 RepID=UPI0037B3574E